MFALQLPSRKLEVELTTLSSNYHVELNPSDVGNNDRYVVQEIIKVGPASSSGTGVWFTPAVTQGRRSGRRGLPRAAS